MAKTREDMLEHRPLAAMCPETGAWLIRSDFAIWLGVGSMVAIIGLPLLCLAVMG